MATVRDLLATKGSLVRSIGPEAKVLDAAREMNAHKIGGLVVLEQQRLKGIITERDILQRIVAEQRDPAQEIWQVVPARMVPFVSVMLAAPVTAVMTAELPQLVCVAGEELLTVTSGGR